jgi:hypothetical protein
MNKCSDFEKHSMMDKRLGNVMSSIYGGNGGMELFEAFLEDFVDCSGFLDYFKALWFPKLGWSICPLLHHFLLALSSFFLLDVFDEFFIQLFNMSATAQCLPGAWTTVLKTTPLASAEVASAIESYHHLLKLRLLNEADESIYQRADWLVHMVGTKVHSYYWLDEFSGKESFSRYWRSEWKNGPNQWQQGLQISDSDIEDHCARVVCQKVKERSHAVVNPGSELALCDCNWSMKGNLCKHVMKLTKVCRDRGLAPPSSALLRYYQALANVVRCPPAASVVCDHAIAVAVSVRTQLEMLLSATNGCSPNTSALKDRQSTSEPTEPNTEAPRIENGTCASRSLAVTSKDGIQVPLDEDSDQDTPACKKRRSGGASEEDKAATMQIVQPSDGPASPERESGEASDGDEGTAEMQGSDGDEGSAEMQASDSCGETAATPVMQPSETEGSEAQVTPELNDSSDD